MGKARPLDDDPQGSVAASQDALFGNEDGPHCDACGVVLTPEYDREDDSRGRGTYLWVRGGHVELEHVPLCASCASAIGMTALARWEIEEEGG
jgi:hypothetical protein